MILHKLPNGERIIGAEAEELIAGGEQRVVFSIDNLPQVLDEVGARTVLMVVDRGAIQATGLHHRLPRLLAGREVREFSDFTPNPTLSQATAASRTAGELQADAVVAIGGGSCLDVAKIAALFAATPELIDGATDATGPPLGLIAVPTTSGTGSEATRFAAIYVDGEKASISHPEMRPRYVILDSALHRAMPASLAAITGLDALAQSLESLWAVDGDEHSNKYALCASGLIVDALAPSVLRGDLAPRTRMMVAAHLAGRAIDRSKTTAAHALSYRLTSRFGIPHGHAVGLLVGYVGQANFAVNESDCLDPRGPDYVRRQVRLAAEAVGSSPQQLPAIIAHIMEQVGLPSTLKAAGVPADAVYLLADGVNQERLANNPRRFGDAGLRELLCRAYG